jgi:hypothetical protein
VDKYKGGHVLSPYISILQPFGNDEHFRGRWLDSNRIGIKE